MTRRPSRSIRHTRGATKNLIGGCVDTAAWGAVRGTHMQLRTFSPLQGGIPQEPSGSGGEGGASTRDTTRTPSASLRSAPPPRRGGTETRNCICVDTSPWGAARIPHMQIGRAGSTRIDPTWTRSSPSPLVCSVAFCVRRFSQLAQGGSGVSCSPPSGDLFRFVSDGSVSWPRVGRVSPVLPHQGGVPERGLVSEGEGGPPASQ